MEGTDAAIFGIKLAFSFAAVVLIVVVIVWPIWRILRTKPEILDTFSQVSQLPIEEDEELEIPTEGAKPDRLGMVQAARSDPNRTAMLVSQWLKEKK